MMPSGMFYLPEEPGRGGKLIDRREIDFTSNGKEYKLIEKPAVLLVRYVYNTRTACSSLMTDPEDGT